MLANPAQKPWADATKVILPTFAGGGTHVNVSGVVLAKHAPHKAEALKLIEWLAGEKAQLMYADVNYEYPLRSGIAINPVIAAFGTLKPDAMPLSKIADSKKAASALVDKVGFDN
jgi:iron(III) transport system substrate-binding protein